MTATMPNFFGKKEWPDTAQNVLFYVCYHLNLNQAQPRSLSVLPGPAFADLYHSVHRIGSSKGSDTVTRRKLFAYPGDPTPVDQSVVIHYMN
jgi:hypothetical protein